MGFERNPILRAEVLEDLSGSGPYRDADALLEFVQAFATWCMTPPEVDVEWVQHA
jgi:hypothetical protein